MHEKTGHFLPASRAEMAARGWKYVDVVLVTGDAYVDHPSFGVALIGRLLEANGYRVAILSQPRHHIADDFRQFGAPRLFFGITAGNLDSIVANYSGNAKVRDRDDYSPGGNPYFGAQAEKKMRRRPDRATILYSNLAQAAYLDVPVILGGIEASLRRFVHYDYQQQRLRGSVLTDAKADLLIYGMGERAVLEAAARLTRGEGLAGIAGTCERLTEKEMAARGIATSMVLPSWAEIRADLPLFLEAELTVDRLARSYGKEILLQYQQAAWVVQHPPAAPLSTEELDGLYCLPFSRKPHPASGDVPACRMIKDSITIVRGCCGNCSFCAISRHQGPKIISRSRDSVVEEAHRLAGQQDFSGTISDLGGPTANLYGTSCASPQPCKRHDCLYPKVCRFMKIDEQAMLSLLEAVSGCGGIKHLFVSSGLRMELLTQTPQLLRKLLLHHTPGVMKIAPEHTEDKVLQLMHKPGAAVLEEFLALCREIGGKEGRKFHFTPYLIASHPGCTVADMEKMASRLTALGLAPRQFQDFTPTPGTISTAMYVTELDSVNRNPLFVAKKDGERRAQRLALDAQAGGAEAAGRKGKSQGAGGVRKGAVRSRSEKLVEQRQGKKGKNNSQANQGRGKLRRKTGHDG
ncbi:YgiQ family radical SAM protein [Thiovibrio frasassiensis]|uniref:YgiQ family radical SAM protein n=1 Tax=Thiovibrio frasassiensis TaxID=2984131 RepID=A0A9X4MKU5_9BACT|nr:YgiQ family radical SAM protein [Thiovibrio frasassiensis]MDG4476644.1 YgiQ family radical SAM protein [Thiovibrio frasassiensis]